MVRVISAHHFASQHIQTVEQPTASTIAPPNRLLLALASHCIEVRDLDAEGDVLFAFPTVDEVTQIIHCLHGNYVTTMESKFNCQNRDTNFVRVYVNWDSIATLQQSKMTNSGVSLETSECGMVQPMRARIAGRVTPTTNQSELGSLEMIEIPVKRNPTAIACCQISGNILIQFNATLNIHTFKIKIHDISKLKFIDFEELPIIIELCFLPKQIDFCENYIAVMNKDTLHMFRINTNFNKEHNHTSNEQECDFSFNFSQDEAIDYKKLLMKENLQSKRDNITVHFPSIVKANSAVHRHSPFTFCDKDMKATVRIFSSAENKPHFETENLIQLKLRPIIIENSQKQISEEFKCFVLKPLYVEQNKMTNNDYDKYIKSDYRHLLNSVVCMVATQQEGYMYQFCDSDSDLNVDKCISVYPFTAPVYKLVMEDYFLHAITETGLETYTVRIGHQLCRNLDIIDNTNLACPPISESVCLIGLRPFLGIENIHICANYLVLLANADSSPTHSVSSNSSSNTALWTMYSLELPSPKVVFSDVLIIADSHKFTSAQTYRHLVSEAHMVLRLSLTLIKWISSEGHVQSITKSKNNMEDLVKSYRDSCILLADHFIMCANQEDYSLTVPYYKMGAISPFDVLKRVKKLQEQSNNMSTKGLIYYLSRILLDFKHGPDAEKFFNSGSKQNFAEAILEIFENHNFVDLPHLILKSNILKEYSTDRLTNTLSNKSYSDVTKENEKMLAMCILYIQRCNVKKAQEMITNMNKEELHQLLLEHWELLFDTPNTKNKIKGMSTFSELAIILMSVHGDLLAELFVVLIFDKHCLNINKVLKVFLEYLPSSIGCDVNNASSILQLTLELYFKKYFARQDTLELPLSYDRATHDAMKFLVRSYLSQLQILHLKEKNNSNLIEDTESLLIEDDENEKDNDKEKFKYGERNVVFENKSKKEVGNYLFAHLRYEYLDKMPPFQINVTAQLFDTDNNFENITTNSALELVLKKLQALLCSQVVPKQVLIEINTFLNLNTKLPGCTSLQTLLLNINDAITFLIDTCPQCLQQYGKDRFKKTDEWKFLIVTVQMRILHLSQNVEMKNVCQFYRDLLKDILTYVAQSMNLDQLIQVFPQKMNNDVTNVELDKNAHSNADLSSDNSDILNEIENYEPYITICKETMHANQIRQLITATGQQLLCTLNL